jgi:hypothetical protein
MRKEPRAPVLAEKLERDYVDLLLVRAEASNRSLPITAPVHEPGRVRVCLTPARAWLGPLTEDVNI